MLVDDDERFGCDDMSRRVSAGESDRGDGVPVDEGCVRAARPVGARVGGESEVVEEGARGVLPLRGGVCPVIDPLCSEQWVVVDGGATCGVHAVVVSPETVVDLHAGRPRGDP